MKNRKKGFSLVELIVAVAILAILAVYFSPSFVNTSSSTKEKSDDAIVKSLETEIAMASQNVDIYKIGRKIADESIDETIKYTYVLDDNRMLIPEKCEIQTESGIVSSKDDTDLGRQMDDLLDEVDRYVGLNLDMSEMESELYRTQKYIINVQYKDLDYRVNTTVEMEDVGYDGYYNEPDEEDWGTVEEDELQTVMISFDPNGGTCEETSRTVQYGEDIGELPKAKKVGYIFSGWFTAPDGGVAVTPTTDATEDMTLYASYVADTNVSYKIRYWVQIRGADPSVENATNYTQFSQVTRNATANAEIPAELIAIDGYITPEQKTVTVMPDNSTVVDYYYKLKNHTIKVGVSLNGVKMYTNMPLKANVIIDGRNVLQNVNEATLNVVYGSTYEVETNLSAGYGYTGNVTVTPSNATYTYDANLGRISGIVEENTEILIELKEKTYTISYNGLEEADRPLPDNPTGYNFATSTIVLKNPTRAGYHFVGWTGSNGMMPQINVTIQTGDSGDKVYTANWIESDSTLYTVKHWVQNVDGNAGTHNDLNYTLRDIEPFVGTTGAIVTPETKEYIGFNQPIEQSETIRADGKLEINYYYTRKSYSVTLNQTEGIESVFGQGSYLFEQQVTIQAVLKNGWAWDRWDGNIQTTHMNYSFRMPAVDVVNTAMATRVDYNITYNLDGGYASGNPTSYNYNSPNITLKNPTKEGFVFIGWTGSNGSEKSLNVVIPTGSEGNREYTAHWDLDSNKNGVPDRYEKKVVFEIKNGTWADGTVGEIVVYLELLNNERQWSELGTATLVAPTGMKPYPQYKNGAWSPALPTMVSGNEPVRYTYTFDYFSYIISFVGNGGTGYMEPIAKEYQTNTKLPENKFNRDGYAFVGWSLERDGEISFKDGALIDRDLTNTENEIIQLYAIWKIKAYSISYDYNGADSPLPANPTEYTINTPTFTLAVPKRVGYTFAGWTGTNGTTPQTSVSVAIGSKGALTFKANWTTINNVKYVVNHWQHNADGIASSQDEMNYTLAQSETLYGKTGLVVEPARKTYDGFIAPSAKSEVIRADGSLVIDYYYERVKYSVTLNKDAGIDSVYGADSYYWGSEVSVNAVTKEAYTWGKWTGYQESTEEYFVFTMPKQNVVLTATTAENSYNIYYELNGGTVTGNPTTFTKDDTFTLNNPTKRGYTFLGWTGLGIEEPTMSMTLPQGTLYDQTFVAHWEVNVYTITYNLNGGTTITELPTTYTIQTGDLYIENPVLEGYNFLGWTGTDLTGNTLDLVIPTNSIGDRHYVANFASKSDTPYIVRHWIQKLDGDATVKDENNYELYMIDSLTGVTGNNVTPELKSITGFTAPSTQTKVIKDDGTTEFDYYYTRNSYTLTLTGDKGVASTSGSGTYLYESAVDISAVLKAGYDWVNWDGVEDLEYINETILIPANNISFEAKTSVITLSIEYSFNDENSVSKATVSPANPETFTVETPTFTLTNPVRSGYTFLGWTGSNGDTPQKTVQVTKGTVTALLFVANWEINEYTIDYDLVGGALESGRTNPITYTVETPTFVLNNPSKTGYEFLGWTGTNLTTNTLSVSIAQGSIGNRSYVANFKSLETTYTVNHLLEQLDGTYKLEISESFIGMTDDVVTPELKSYEGFTAPTLQTITLAGDGTSVVDYYYIRNSYTLTMMVGDGVMNYSINGNQVLTGTFKYGEQVNINCVISEGYGWKKWYFSKTADFAAITTSDTTQNLTFAMVPYNAFVATKGFRNPVCYLYSNGDLVFSPYELPTPSGLSITDMWFGTSEGNKILAVDDGYNKYRKVAYNTPGCSCTTNSSCAHWNRYAWAEIEYHARSAAKESEYYAEDGGGYNPAPPFAHDRRTSNVKKVIFNAYSWPYSTRLYFHSNKDGSLYPNLKTVVINDDSMYKVDDQFVYGCRTLKSWTISDDVAEMEGYCAERTHYLPSIRYPRYIPAIRYSGFKYMETVTKVALPPYCVKCEGDGFYNAYKLNTVHIPLAFKAAEGAGFHGTALKYVYYEGTLTDWSGISITTGSYSCKELKNAKYKYYQSYTYT